MERRSKGVLDCYSSRVPILPRSNTPFFMNKSALLRAVIAELETDLHRQQDANRQASAGATDGEARAETKWDTCGLESSYLARGHALQFKALVADLETLRTFMIPLYGDLPIGPGALIETELDKEKMICFLLPCAGGTEVDFDGKSISVITPSSPIGAALMNKKKGNTFSFRAGSIGKILSVC
jgi:hypothetical protein